MFKITKNLGKKSQLIKRNFSTLKFVKERDNEFVKNVMTNDIYSANDFSNFLRVLSRDISNDELVRRFENDLPKHISYLDDLDTRKAISVVLRHPELHKNEILISLLRERFQETKRDKTEKANDDVIKIGNDYRKQPLSIRFWILYARMRERIYKFIRRNGFNLK